MKKINLTLLLSGLIIVIEITGCKKESDQTINNTGQTVENANKPPVAHAGNDITIWWPANTALLNGTRSYDPENDNMTFKWTKIYGRNGIIIANPDSSITNITNLEAGLYRFNFSVNDSKGAEANAMVTVLVNSSYHMYVNINPADTMIGLSAGYVPLRASAISQDGNNNHWTPVISNIEWSNIYGPASYSFQSTNNLSTQVAGLGTGTYAFQCKLTDTAGMTGYGYTVVSVADPASSEQEMILHNQNWIGIAPLGGPEILTSIAQLPVGHAIKNVFVKEDCDSVFREASHSSNPNVGYRFGFSLYYNFNGNATGLMLYVWPRDWNHFCGGTADIKIVY
jgi:hypothetical protein